MSFFKKQPVFSLVVGILLTVYAILTRVINNVDFFNPSLTVGRIVFAVGLIAFALFISFPPAFRSKNGTTKTLKFLEGLILIVGAALGFILPLFELGNASLGSGSLWFGLALLMNGSVDLYLGTHSKTKVVGLHFLLKLTFVIFGTYIYAVDFVDSKIDLATFVVLLAAGIALALIGLFNLKKK